MVSKTVQSRRQPFNPLLVSVTKTTITSSAAPNSANTTPSSSSPSFAAYLASDGAAHLGYQKQQPKDEREDETDFIFPVFKNAAEFLLSLGFTHTKEQKEDDQSHEEMREDPGREVPVDTEEEEYEVSDMIFQSGEDDDDDDVAPSPLFRAMQFESRCLSELAFDLFVAFDEESNVLGPEGSEETLRTPDEGLPFTHILKIRQSPSPQLTDQESVYLRFDSESGVSTLAFLVPSSGDEDGVESPPCDYNPPFYESGHHPSFCSTLTSSPLDIRLTPYQLSVFRDFVGASGYSLPVTPNPTSPPLFSHGQSSSLTSMAAVASARVNPASDHTTRILITTPRDRRTDAIAAAAYYLAWEMDLLVEDVVGAICDNDDACVVWRVGSTVGDGYGGVGGEEQYVDWVESLLV